MWSRKRLPDGAAVAATEAVVGTAAATMLARRDYSSGELRAKLRARGYDEALVGTVLADLAERRLIDDVRYAASYVHYHAERGQGPQRIKRDLAEFDLDQELIETAVSERDWSRQAREVRIRKFGLEVPVDWAAKAKQSRFLQYRGFSADHIRSALGFLNDDD